MVSGTISPDVTGTYTRAGNRDGYPYWRNDLSGYEIYWGTVDGDYIIADTHPIYPIETDAWWLGSTLDEVSVYEPQGTATGQATVKAAV